VDAVDPAAVEISNLIAALGAVSEAAISRYEIVVEEDVTTPQAFTPGASYDIADKLVLEFETNVGALASVTIPCPKGTLLDDSDNVSTSDLNGALIQAFWDELVASWRSADGQSPATLVRGYRIRTARDDA